MKEKKDELDGGRKRSVAYPSITVEQALSDIKKLRENLGAGPYSRERVASGLGYTSISGASARRVAALAHFGLLDKKGSTYKQSELASKILYPTSDEEQMSSIRTAFLTPTIYSSLVAAYNGKSLPLKLSNILIHDYQVTENVAESVAADFQTSAEFVGVLKNGVLDLSGVTEETFAAEKTVDLPLRVGFEKSNTSDHKQDFVFEFSGITLVVPQTAKTSEAIADGELKEIRRALSDFAEKYITEGSE